MVVVGLEEDELIVITRMGSERIEILGVHGTSVGSGMPPKAWELGTGRLRWDSGEAIDGQPGDESVRFGEQTVNVASQVVGFDGPGDLRERETDGFQRDGAVPAGA